VDRRRFLVRSAGALAAGASVVGAYGFAVEPRRLQVSVEELPFPPPRPATLVQLSDLHFGRLRPFHRQVAEACGEADPDLIVLTGDTAHDPDDLPELATFLELLPRDVPVVAVLGNWEYWGGVAPADLARTLEAHGGRLLRNEGVSVAFGGTDLEVVGLDDLVAGRPAPEVAVGTGSDTPTLVLAHCPAQRDRLPSPAGGSGWVLSGHTHGGQVDLFGVRYTPRGSGPYVEGWYRGDAGAPWDLYVSRGLGTSVVPFRLGALPQLTVFRSG
jgi:hypothetical protein